MKQNCTQWIVDQAMEITSKDVRSPKCVRDSIIKPLNKYDRTSNI